MNKAFVWDVPVRVFHWSLALLFCVSLYTGFNGGLNEMDYHMLSGYAILSLVAFRVLWGFLGSRNARFASFVKGPVAVMEYIRAPSPTVSGHNPLGALGIIAMLLVVALQAGTGLFSTDDVFVDGPLRHLVSHDTSLLITGIHKINVWAVCALAGLHVAAIGWYHWKRGENLTVPMITGWKQTNADIPAERNNWLLAAILLAAASAGVYCLVKYV